MNKAIITLLRPHQWLKNVFIFLPLFFDRRLMDLDYMKPAFIAFFAYCLAASGIYCFNDIYDVEADRIHPKKCSRPVANGAISIPIAYSIMAICFILSISILSIGEGSLFELLILLFYIIINIAYCIKLKHIAIVDVFIISLGFVLRVLMGGFSTGIYLSHWIILMTFLLALFLAFAKRRDDVVIFEESGVKTRKNINRYNVEFMNQTIGIVAGITMICYIMYTVSPEVMDRFGSKNLYLTSFFVLAGMIRYLQVTIVDLRSGSPTNILIHDRFIQVCILGWVAMFFVIIYVL